MRKYPIAVFLAVNAGNYKKNMNCMECRYESDVFDRMEKIVNIIRQWRI